MDLLRYSAPVSCLLALADGPVQGMKEITPHPKDLETAMMDEAWSQCSYPCGWSCAYSADCAMQYNNDIKASKVP